MPPYPGWAAHIASRVPDSPGLRDLTFGRGVQAFEAGVIHTPDEAVARSHDARGGFPKLVVTVAPSGSGKTSHVTEHFPEHEVISLDALRAELGGDASSQRLNGQVMQLGRERLREALRRGRRVVWDATGLRRDFRRAVLGLGHDYGALTTLLVWTTPEEAAQRRNAARSRTVPAAVIAAQYDGAEFPHVTEAHRTRWHDAEGHTLGEAGFLSGDL